MEYSALDCLCRAAYAAVCKAVCSILGTMLMISTKLNASIPVSAVAIAPARSRDSLSANVVTSPTNAHATPIAVRARMVVAIIVANGGVAPSTWNATGAKIKAKPAMAPTQRPMASVRATRAAEIKNAMQGRLYST